MHAADLLTDAFGRVRDTVHEVVNGLTPDQLGFQLDDGGNTVAWLVWHLTRIQDDHVAGVAGTEQAWRAEGWEKRFALPFHHAATGYGHTTDDVAAVRVDSPDLLTGYHDAVHERTVRYLAGLTDDELDRVVDDAWDPPVTLGVRLVSVVNDDMQHVGQAAFLRGVLDRGAAAG
jgi:uncharacterized damage-inducible protein DinB